MLPPLKHRLSQQANEAFVGRERDIATILEILDDDGPLVFFLHGIAGVGKSTLLAHFAEHARQRGAVVFELDCRSIEPTAHGFLDELGRLTGHFTEQLSDVFQACDSAEQAIVICLDHYEHFSLMDTWLRQEFLPEQPGNFRLLIAGRQAPVPIWLTSPRWHTLFRVMTVESLDRDSALALLKDSGLATETAQRLAAVTHGNPLALKLAASAARAQRSLTLEDAAIHDVMQELTLLNLADVKNPATREAVQFTSVARRITQSLLRRLTDSKEDLWQQLRDLPFVDSFRDGLRIHDAVREALALTLRANDPEKYLQCRRKAWEQLRTELRSAARSELWRYTADMLYLIENPVVRDAFFPSGRFELAVESANETDYETIREITVLHDGEEGRMVLDLWWRHQTEAFRVVRNREAHVVGYYFMCEAARLKPEIVDGDGISASWMQHLKSDPVPDGARSLLLRRWLAESTGEAPSPIQAACWLDIKRTYMELRPELRRVYLPLSNVPPYAQVATKLGFELRPGTVDIGDISYHTAVLDFGPASVDGWITRLVGDELGVVEESLLDHDARALVIDGARIKLTPLEFGLASYLEQLEGATASRDEILDHVWGYSDGQGSSNVVDAVVKSLRHKLGDHATKVETVRGFGYRWRS